MRCVLVKLRNPQRYVDFGVGTNGLGYTMAEESSFGLAMRVKHHIGRETTLLDEIGTLMVPWSDIEYFFVLDESYGKPAVGFLSAE